MNKLGDRIRLTGPFANWIRPVSDRVTGQLPGEEYTKCIHPIYIALLRGHRAPMRRAINDHLKPVKSRRGVAI